MAASSCTCEDRRTSKSVGCPVHGERKRYRKLADGSYQIIPAAELVCRKHGKAYRIVVTPHTHKVCAACGCPVVE